MCMNHTKFNEIACRAIDASLDAADAVRDGSDDLVELVHKSEDAVAAANAAYDELTGETACEDCDDCNCDPE